jgi:hypothetical protein
MKYETMQQGCAIAQVRIRIKPPGRLITRVAHKKWWRRTIGCLPNMPYYTPLRDAYVYLDQIPLNRRMRWK